MIGLREEASEAAISTYDPASARSRAGAGLRGALRHAVRDRAEGRGRRAPGAAAVPSSPRGCSTLAASGASSARSSSGTSRARSISTTRRASERSRVSASMPMASRRARRRRGRRRVRAPACRGAVRVRVRRRTCQDKTASSDGLVRVHGAVGRVSSWGGDGRYAGGWQPLLVVRHASRELRSPISSGCRLPSRPSRSSTSSPAGSRPPRSRCFSRRAPTRCRTERAPSTSWRSSSAADMRCVRRSAPTPSGSGRSAGSVERERSRLDLAGRLVRRHHDTGRRDRAVDELQPRRDRPVGEELLP